MSGGRGRASQERVVSGARGSSGYTADAQIIEICAVRVPRGIGEKVDTKPVVGTRVTHLSKQKTKVRTTSVPRIGLSIGPGSASVARDLEQYIVRIARCREP